MNRPHGRVVAGAGKHIRLTVPSIEEDDLEAVRATLASGYLVQGERVTAFESAVAELFAVGSGKGKCTASRARTFRRHMDTLDGADK